MELFLSANIHQGNDLFLVCILVADNVLSCVYRRFLQREITRWSCGQKQH